MPPRLRTAVQAAILAAAACLGTAAAPPVDWAALTRADIVAFHAEQAGSHPGPVNPGDPGFAARLAAARDKALARAATVTTAGGYRATLREMVAGFDDGHMYIGFDDSLPVTARWPGFIADWRDGILTVTSAEPGPGVPAVGDRLVACDGRDTAALAAELVAPWQGSWALTAQRERQGWRVFHDPENPFVHRPESCRFTGAGGDRTVALVWRPVPADFASRVAAANSARRAPFELRRFGANLWLSAGSFSADPGPTATALTALVTRLDAEAVAARKAPIVVLDLRGNSGGSSDWGVRMARIVFGTAPVDRLRAVSGAGVHVDWRPSAANIAAISGFCTPLLAKPAGAGADTLAWCRASLAGLQAARAANAALWREPDDIVAAPPAAALAAATPPLRRNPTFLLVDGACGSACLDTVDLWTGLGAIVIGRTTSADTDYMEVRDARLPSGFGGFSVPMKVYRGRPRASGVPVEPRHRYDGDMGDTAALEAWVQTLSP